MKKLLLFLLIIVNIFGGSPKVTFISPSPKGDEFWDKYITCLLISSEKLDIDLKVVYPRDSNRFDIEENAINEIIKNTPQYIIFPFPSLVGKNILDNAEKKKVWSVVVNMSIPSNELVTVKSPGEKYKYWISHIYPDDFDAGYQLGKNLIDLGLKTINFNKIELLGINGSRDIDVTKQREEGLKKAIDETKGKVVLDQVIYSNWKIEDAYEMTLNSLKRYPNIKIIWSASDVMAMAAYSALESRNKKLILGGIDWSNKGIKAVKEKKLEVTLGGHFLDGIIALVLIKDHSANIDISDEKIIKTKFYAINSSNVNEMEKVISLDNLKKMDIRKLSKFYNKKISKYNFDIISLLKK